MSSAATARALRAALFVLAAVAPGALRAQVRPAGGDVTTPRPRGLSLSLAGGFAADAPLGVSRQVGGHGLVAFGYAPRRWPAEVRAAVMAATAGSDVSLGLSGVVPVARAGVAGGTVRPYLLAGVDVAGVGAVRRAGLRVSPGDGRLGAQAGAGVRFERGGYGAFGELRRHTVYGQSFLSFGATLRR